VIFGTGRFLNHDDLYDTSTQTVYGIWDYGDSENEFLGEGLRLNRAGKREVRLSNDPLSSGSGDGYLTLLEQTSLVYDDLVVAENRDERIRILSSLVPDYRTTGNSSTKKRKPEIHAGWFFDLPLAGERVITPVSVHNKSLILVTSTPQTSPCQCGGSSIIHFLNPLTGGRQEHAFIDINRDGCVNDQDKVTVLYGLPDRVPESLMAVPSGIYKPGILEAPKFLPFGTGRENLDTLLFMTSEGKLESVTGKGEKTGIVYWGEF